LEILDEKKSPLAGGVLHPLGRYGRGFYNNAVFMRPRRSP